VSAGSGHTGQGDFDAAGVMPARRPGVGVRLLDTLAWLLAAGILLVGIVLLLAAVVAPAALAAAGLGAADGPGWNKVTAHLAVGVVGELVVRFGRGRSTGIRLLADLVVVLAAMILIWWAWWP